MVNLALVVIDDWLIVNRTHFRTIPWYLNSLVAEGITHLHCAGAWLQLSQGICGLYPGRSTPQHVTRQRAYNE